MRKGRNLTVPLAKLNCIDQSCLIIADAQNLDKPAHLRIK